MTFRKTAGQTIKGGFPIAPQTPFGENSYKQAIIQEWILVFRNLNRRGDVPDVSACFG